MKRLILLSLCLLLSCLQVQATKQLGNLDQGSKFIGYLHQTSYKIQTDNEISFIYHYQNGSTSKFDRIPVFPSGMMIIPEYRETMVIEKDSEELKEFIRNELNLAAVDVFIYRVANNISVLGEVRNPGSFQIKDIKTVYEGIAKAGGFSAVARKSQVNLIRQKKDGTRLSYTIDFPKEVFKAYEPGSGIGEQIYLLQEGDLIYVPGSTPKKFWELFKKAMTAATFGAFTGLVSGALN